jgi:diaminohydroxyphosphoribosylaminopyrimidine deaminase / 5-amino-6-(5-phosphoribosylamino)uracil reductase
LPTEANLWQTEIAPTIVFTTVFKTRGTNLDVQQSLVRQGVEVVAIESLTPNQVMTQLGDRGCLSVLWECGGILAAAAIADQSIQKVLAFVAPKIIGGQDAPSPVGDLGLERMTEALVLQKVKWRSVGEDLLVEGYLKQSS